MSTKLLAPILLLFTYSGCQNTDSEIVDYSFYNRKAEIVKLAFNLNEEELIDFVQNQTNIDLCDDSFRIGEFIWKFKRYRFPIIFFKGCPYPPLIHNTLTVDMNMNNDIIVEEKVVQNKSNLANIVLKESKDRLKYREHSSLIYLFRWTPILNENLIKENLVNTLKGMHMVLNYKALELFNKSLDKLNRDEIEVLQESFAVYILINNYNSPPAPPPALLKREFE